LGRHQDKETAMLVTRNAILACCLFGCAIFAAPSVAQAPQPLAPQKTAPAPAASQAPSPQKAAPAPSAKPAAKQLIDINTASEEELRGLKGVGDVRAAAIIKNRPYKGKDELVQKKIVPQAVYDTIKDKIIAKQQ
jgi:DNA uptake protein ComE-like DNA-binding protein